MLEYHRQLTQSDFSHRSGSIVGIITPDNRAETFKIVNLKNSVIVLLFDSIITNVISGSPKLLNIQLLADKKSLSVSIKIEDEIRDNNILVETENKCLHEIIVKKFGQTDTASPQI